MMVQEEFVEIMDDKTYNDIRYWIASKVINLNETPRSSKSKQQNILTVDSDIVTNDMVSKSIEDLYKQNHFDNSMNEASTSNNINVEIKKRFDRKKKSCYRPSCCVADIKANSLGLKYILYFFIKQDLI